ncbi:MAG: SLC13 family permease [Planctomycetaceae bacterium]
MSPESIYLAVVLAGALLLFYTGWVRTDATALLVMLSLMVPWPHGPGGAWKPILKPAQAFSGFGSPAVVMVASMFVLSAALVRTGGAQMLGGRLLAMGARSERMLQFTILVVVTLFSAVINDTTTVLIWMPMVLAVCHERGYSPSRVLLPLAFASLLGGQWTLIGTRSNLILSDYLRTRTGHGLSFFAFTPVAVAVWGAAVAWFLVAGRRLLPRGAAAPSLAEHYEVAEYLTEVMAMPGSEFTGKTLEELDLAATYRIRILGVVRDGEHLPATGRLKVEPGDVLIFQGRISSITEVLSRPGFQVKAEMQIGEKTLRSVDLRMVEALVAPNSGLEGSSLEETEFLARTGVSLLAIGRHGRPLSGRPVEQELRAGDSLLLVGHESQLHQLRRDPDVVLLMSRSLPPVGRSRAYGTMALLVFLVLASATHVLEPSFAIPLAAAAAVLTGCIGMRSAYESLNLPALMVVAGMIPFGLALEETETARLLAEAVRHLFGSLGPHAIFAALLLTTVLLTQLIENAAVAVLLAPVAYELALSVGAEPTPFLLGVAICVSASFMTPVAHESTILVMEPGRYTFRDYLRSGAPLAFLTWAVTVVVVPLIYPLTS